VRKIMKTNDEVSHISAVSEGGLLCWTKWKHFLLECPLQYEW